MKFSSALLTVLLISPFSMATEDTKAWSASSCEAVATYALNQAETVLNKDSSSNANRIEAAEIALNSMVEINFHGVMKNGKDLFSTGEATAKKNHAGCISAHESLSKFLSNIPGGIEEYIQANGGIEAFRQK